MSTLGNLLKLRGLADFTEAHGARFHRIEAVAKMKDDTLRVLDLTEPRSGKPSAMPTTPSACTSATQPRTTKARAS